MSRVDKTKFTLCIKSCIKYFFFTVEDVKQKASSLWKSIREYNLDGNTLNKQFVKNTCRNQINLTMYNQYIQQSDSNG